MSGWASVIMLVVGAGLTAALGVIGAMTGYQLGVRQGRDQVDGWQQGRPLER